MLQVNVVYTVSHVQWSLSIKDTLGPQFLPPLQRFPRFRGHLIVYSGTLNGVLITEVSAIHERFVIVSPRSH